MCPESKGSISSGRIVFIMESQQDEAVQTKGASTSSDAQDQGAEKGAKNKTTEATEGPTSEPPLSGPGRLKKTAMKLFGGKKGICTLPVVPLPLRPGPSPLPKAPALPSLAQGVLRLTASVATAAPRAAPLRPALLPLSAPAQCSPASAKQPALGRAETFPLWLFHNSESCLITES